MTNHKGHMYSKGILQTFMVGIIPILCKLFQNIRKEEIVSNSFYKANISMLPKPDQDIMRKENYKLISLVFISAKTLNTILASQIQ